MTSHVIDFSNQIAKEIHVRKSTTPTIGTYLKIGTREKFFTFVRETTREREERRERMTKYLPPNLIVLFRPRPPIEFQEPLRKRKMPPYTGIGAFLERCKDPKLEGYVYTPGFETRPVKRLRKMEEVKAKHAAELAEKVKEYDPNKDEKIEGDAYKTLVVGRLPYELSEPALRREFEAYGPVNRVRIIYDREGKSRGYGFVEFEKERDMRTAYKQADGRRILGRRILVDVERGRTVKNWVPRRLGGGLGNPRPDMAPKIGKKGRYIRFAVTLFSLLQGLTRDCFGTFLFFFLVDLPPLLLLPILDLPLPDMEKIGLVHRITITAPTIALVIERERATETETVIETGIGTGTGRGTEIETETEIEIGTGTEIETEIAIRTEVEEEEEEGGRVKGRGRLKIAVKIAIAAETMMTTTMRENSNGDGIDLAVRPSLPLRPLFLSFFLSFFSLCRRLLALSFFLNKTKVNGKSSVGEDIQESYVLSPSTPERYLGK